MDTNQQILKELVGNAVRIICTNPKSIQQRLQSARQELYIAKKEINSNKLSSRQKEYWDKFWNEDSKMILSEDKTEVSNSDDECSTIAQTILSLDFMLKEERT